MPELPEVESIRLQLREKILNKKIEEVLISDKRLIKDISVQTFKENIEGKFIEEVLRRGKVLIIKLKDGGYLIIHLRISGWLVLSNTAGENFSRVSFKLSDKRLINFCDTRILGEIRLISDYNDLSIIARMGPEVLEINKEEFVSLFNRKKSRIKPLLMDQNFLAGVGNIYAQEALFCAGVHPGRTVDKIQKYELEKIYDCLVSILKKAIEKKGSSVDLYRQVDGKKGEFAAYLKVYQRAGQPCPKCKTPIEKKTIGARGTCFCPRCQK